MRAGGAAVRGVAEDRNGSGAGREAFWVLGPRAGDEGEATPAPPNRDSKQPDEDIPGARLPEQAPLYPFVFQE